MQIPITLRQQCRRLAEGDTQTPIRLFMQLSRQNPHALLLESAEVDGRWGRYSIIATDYLAEFSCCGGRLDVRTHDEALRPLEAYSGLPYMEGMRAVMKALVLQPDRPEMAPITRALYGYWGYEMAAVFQPKLAESLDVAAAESRLVLPATVFVFDHVYNQLDELSIGECRDVRRMPPLEDSQPQPFSVGEVTYAPSEEVYKAGVRRVRDLLQAGEAIQVVGSSQCSAPFEGDAFTLYRRLRSINPSPYMFFMRFEGLELIGASPEVMVQCNGGQLLLAPIAGTRRRGANAAEDEAFADEMRRDPKECAEHVMLVDLGRNDLGRVATSGSVQVRRLMDVERFSHVMHMTSRVTAELKQGADALDVLASCFPAGTVSGAPKLRAMQIIRELEPLPRGPYAGCIGWMGLDRDAVHLDTGITIRSMWLRDGRLHWQTGAGLVFDSKPESEWAECRNKGRVIDSVLAAQDF
ncbi:MAG TPA: anthranilate synthase component I family protein [Candidatus Akkermansia intestinigallinarum]|uniref:anthranilate synthase n=1 Tax=Candidatus Akkermansia intestinigallinarum TaxID=2838431 RepID=A0A9D1VB58_9BACT|nr:anthranilate synthase component I family protein [Candidatus Akkermansia intestinigallinarum]